jgi:hypothetical protein
MTMLGLFSLVYKLVNPERRLTYHLHGSPLLLFAAAIVDISLLWLLWVGVFLVMEKSRAPRLIIWSCITLFLPWVLFKNWMIISGHPFPYWFGSVFFIAPILCSAAVFCFCRWSFRRTFVVLQKCSAGLLACAGMIGAVWLPQLAWISWQVYRANASSTLNDRHETIASTTRPHPRIIWILFDELSYQQVYGHRFADVQMPAFDELASQSTVFKNVVPAGAWTELAIPSLFTGVKVGNLQIAPEGQLTSMFDIRSREWRPFNQSQTIFEDAIKQGYKTGVTGWYNPYCRILSTVLNKCYWAFRWPLYPGVMPDQAFLNNLVGPLMAMIPHRVSLISKIAGHPNRRSELLPERDAAIHIEDYRDLATHADLLLRDSSIDFVFLHLPIPHPGGIFDRRHMVFATSHASYLDNLVLADQYLAHVRSILEQQKSWDTSTVVVMGDHSWRTKLLWSLTPQWTKEENLASDGGTFDNRPAYIVKLPLQKSPASIDVPFDAIWSRRLFDSIMSKDIVTAKNLHTWVETVSQSNSNGVAPGMARNQ